MGRIRESFRRFERRLLRGLMSIVAAIANRRVARHLDKTLADEHPDADET